MFDSFEGKWKCSKCGTENVSKDIQTKDLELNLAVYREGDRVNGFDDKFNYVNGHDSCSGCNTFMEMRLHLDEGVWNGKTSHVEPYWVKDR